nr:MAG TPA: TFIIB zinc-binding [Caudoviricetes sp.]
MNNTPKCPGCGADMELMHLCNAAFCYACTKCGWGSPIGIDSESAFRMAMRRTEPKNRVLTLEELKAYCTEGADAAPLWYEDKDNGDVSRWMVIDLPELAFGSTATVKRLLNSQFFEPAYGENWRCWLRKPTKEEMEGTPWEN